MDKETAGRMVAEHEWTVKELTGGQEGKPFRRVVPSPEPIGIEEIQTIRILLDNEMVTIGVGGGGIPFILKANGEIVWVDAVIDKDAATALAAIILEIKFLAIFTAEEGLYTPEDFARKGRKDNSVRPIEVVTVAEARQMLSEMEAGSMGPKLKALADYTEKTQNESWVGPLDDGFNALKGEKGTFVVPD